LDCIKRSALLADSNAFQLLPICPPAQEHWPHRRSDSARKVSYDARWTRITLSALVDSRQDLQEVQEISQKAQQARPTAQFHQPQLRGLPWSDNASTPPAGQRRISDGLPHFSCLSNCLSLYTLSHFHLPSVDDLITLQPTPPRLGLIDQQQSSKL
jgi:hypothetical protein